MNIILYLVASFSFLHESMCIALYYELFVCLTAKWEQSLGKQVTLPAELNWASVYMRKKDDPSPPSQELITVLAHALIVLSIPSLPDWASQSCFMEKKVARLGGWHGVAALTFSFLCKRGLSSFVLRGCKKSWLAPDSFGRQEILLSETCVLHQYKRLLSTAEKRLLD